MLVSLEWISDFLNLEGIDADDLAERMSRTGLEVEGIINYGANLNHLVVGEVSELEEHPESDHLKIAQVNDGSSDLRQIVCGAPNIASGQKVIVAIPGAHLPGDLLIETNEIRGIVSKGMICSLQELGISSNLIPKKYEQGIFVLPEQAPVGADAVQYLKLDDPILDIDLTPNRADALSYLGNAYEIGAIINQTPKLPTITMDEMNESTKFNQVSILVDDATLAPAYQLRLIENVKVQESPLWLQMRLIKAGIRPINNIVDVTNYYLLQYGQPMHAFDFDKLPSTQIQVKLAKEGEALTTLDNVDRSLSANDLVVCADDQPIALAGVMGGIQSEVTSETRNVLLETAIFNPVNIRSTSKRLSLRSESSARFEKGVNMATLSDAGNQAAQLIAELGDGQLIKGIKEFNHIDIKNIQIEVSNLALPEKIGIELTQKEISQIIERLGFKVSFAEDSYTVEIPPRRWDIKIEADVLEEIARIYGYDRIPTTIPAISNVEGLLSQTQTRVRRTRDICEGMGLNQVISYALTSEENAQLLKSPNHELVRLSMPMSEERSCLRQSMLPALIEIAQYNQARQNQHLAFYEQGRVFLGQGDLRQPIEAERLAILVSGQYQENNWYNSAKNYDFYVIKGMLDTYFEALRMDEKIVYQANTEIEAMHPGRTANILVDNQVIGLVGQLHPNLSSKYDLSDQTYFAELDFDFITNYPSEELVQAPIAKYPATSRDLALLVDLDQSHQNLVNIIKANGTANLIDIHLFDYYEGENIGNNKKSLAYHLVFQNPERTLVDKEVDQIMGAIGQALQTIEGLQIR